ncbi:MAG: carboxypeptidase regulatory-like domain-containing protein [Polyangiales bacterium]
MLAALAVLAVFAALRLARCGRGPSDPLPPDAADAGFDASLADAPLPLEGPRSIEGFVQDDLGNALADATIRVSRGDDGPAREVRSDDIGAFRVSNLPVEVLEIEVSRMGHEGKQHTARPDDAGQLTFVLARQGELRVALRDRPGQGVDGADVVVTGPGLWPAQAAQSDARGEHVFKGLAAGEYRVRARRGGRIGPPSEPVSVIPGERSEVELVLEAGAQLVGVVVDQQTRRPVPDARVAVQDLTPGIDATSVITDARGAFEATGLWPGSVRIDVQLEGYAPLTRDVALPIHERLELAISGAAALAGTVVDDDGRAVVGARLSVTTRDGLPFELAGEPGRSASDASRPRGADGTGELGVTRGPVPPLPLFGGDGAAFALGTLAAETDVQGHFRIDELTPRPLVLHAVRPGYVPARIAIDDLKPHAERRGLRVVLKAAGRVSGRVVDARGHGLSSVYVAARGPETEQSSVTDGSGNYTVEGVLGAVTVEAQPDGRTILRCQTQVNARGTARCDLTAATAVHELPVRVVDAYGIGLEGALITLTASTTHASSQLSRRDGTLLLRELPPPPYKLSVSLNGYLEIDEQQVERAEREITVRLQRAATLAGFVLDALGHAVPDAVITLSEGTPSDETDAQGAFTLDGVPPGTQVVQAHHASAGDGKSQEVRARPGERLDGVRIVLPKRYQPGTKDDDEPTRRPAARGRPERASAPELELSTQGRNLAITKLPPSSALAKAGVRAGDVLVAIDGETPLSAAHARGLLAHPPGRVASVRVLRGQRPVNVRVRRGQ